MFNKGRSHWTIIASAIGVLIATPALAGGRPNILWITCEDISPHLGCYGDPHAITPHLDRLATDGMRYTHAFTTAGVCAPCRSGIITGLYQTTLGTHNMRCRARLPGHIRPFPTYLRQAGYYCTNNEKEDYQFNTPSGTWDESSGQAHWRNRPQLDQPFFAVFNYGGCHESGIARDSKYQEVTSDLTPEQRQNPDELTTLPPYYADTPTAREDWKRNYELITAMDSWAGRLIAQLKEDGLYDNTIIFFWSDHGVGLPRAKRWLYDSGTHVPLIVRIPSAYRTNDQGRPGTVVRELVSSIDYAPTVLNLAGIEVPESMQGRAFLGPQLSPSRDYVYGARDRMDERYDIIRMVRDRRYKYLRNYVPWQPYYQYMNTSEKGATMRELRQLHDAGRLSAHTEHYFNQPKPIEELYDTQSDPHELHNLADDPAQRDVLNHMRTAHLDWVAETRDVGLIPESIVARLEQEVASRYEILRNTGGEQLAQRISRAAVLATDPAGSIPQLYDALSDDHPAVRYWGAVGLGNLATADASVLAALQKPLEDRSAAVRIAAARAICRLSADNEAALAVLARELEDGQQWERLQAAIVLDEIDELARPVLATMRAALQPRRDLFTQGKYTVRVINRALNELEGTMRVVR